MMKMVRVLLVGAILGLGLVAGCSDDDPVTPPETIVLPPDADLLMAEFVELYEGMDGDRLAELVHPAAKIFLLPSTLAEWAAGSNPLTFTFFERDSLLAAHGNMFSGETGLDSTGYTIPPVASIAVDSFQKGGVWAVFDDPAGDFAGLEVYSVVFNVLIYFNNPDNHRFEIRQDVVMFVTELDETDLSGWQLLGWRGLSPIVKAGTENTSWGDILCMYR